MNATHDPSLPYKVLAVAQWIARKGIVELVTAWGLLNRQDAILELIGETDADPPYQRAVLAAIAQLPPHAHINVRGVISDTELTDAYASATCFALPTHYEGYGMAFAEALVAHVPIITCPVGPVAELVGDAGIFVPPRDPAALCNALRHLLDTPPLQQQLSAAAQRRASQIPTWAETTTHFQKVLEGAAACKR